VHFVDHAVAQGIVAQLRIFGGSVGVAVSMILLNNDISASLKNVLSAEQLGDFYSKSTHRAPELCPPPRPKPTILIFPNPRFGPSN